ncbi:MAG: glycosyltransferase family 2 protein, partial [Lachnospiraceae bacterium]|nr:glycosyltransferase family 2 protein [Lachnospiraceae bacterium]
MDLDLAFIILHYMSLNDTVEAIESIRKFADTDSYKIIVIDNYSPDNSFVELNNRYSNDSKVIIIHNDQNLGFAKGNNIGIDFVRKNFKTRFVVVMNNDTLLFQGHLFSNLCKAFSEHKFSVLGPMIISGDGSCVSNPIEGGEMSLSEAKSRIAITKRMHFLSKFYLDEIVYGKCRELFRKIKKSTKEVFTKKKFCVENYNVKVDCKLHGSFLVFSDLFFEVFDGFDPRTFLFMEENILYVHLVRNHLISLYYPEIVIFHKEDASTDKSFGNGRKKRLFINSENAKAIGQYIEVLNE